MPLQFSFGDGLSCNCLNLRILGIPNDTKQKWVPVPSDLIRIKLYSLSQVHHIEGKSIVACKGCCISLFVVKEVVHDLKLYLKEKEDVNVEIYVYEKAKLLSTFKDTKTVSQFGIRMDMLSSFQDITSNDQENLRTQLDPEIDTCLNNLVSERKKENRQALLAFLRSQQNSYEEYTKKLRREAFNLNQNTLHEPKIRYEGEMKAFVSPFRESLPNGKSEVKHSHRTRRSKSKKHVAFTDKFEVISSDKEHPTEPAGSHKQSLNAPQFLEALSNKDNDGLEVSSPTKDDYNSSEELAFDISFSDSNGDEQPLETTLPSGTGESDTLTSEKHSKEKDVFMELDSSYSERLPMTIQSSSYTERTSSSSLSSDSSFEAPTASFVDRKERWSRMLQKADEHSRSVRAKSMGYNLANDDPNLITSYKHSFLSHGWKSLN
ncbi:tor Complex Tor2 interacting protein 1 [Schizosaccharomyces cryophilus OY26]|uniref:Tor Complex Tor2 interacting protein 1 n=1 Tax=Schizosaccharomyces cryophilus (strain OY26 / ATCC MYA-4695 / CBS 11777 / NBRC 106824 / NRRL Y48691) TaxID=653667 RepID=S9W2T5_SCHCR|nr:tor Complex Tor2 interacting protein 1 [Schizosaccharomyces cryophilus OY26]EPY52854.1 tor Complex Tor2 interacting protein 1 [Schizosaccharomyces cryophilus OY26]